MTCGDQTFAQKHNGHLGHFCCHLECIQPARLAQARTHVGEGVLDVDELLRQGLRPCTLAVQLVQALGQRREDICGGDAALLDQFFQLFDRDTHATGCRLQRPWECLG